MVHLRPANERRRYFVTTSLIGWAQTSGKTPTVFFSNMTWQTYHLITPNIFMTTEYLFSKLLYLSRPQFYQTRSAWSKDQGSTKKRSAVHNFVRTVTKFCVPWEALSLPHDTKFGNCRNCGQESDFHLILDPWIKLILFDKSGARIPINHVWLTLQPGPVSCDFMAILIRRYLFLISEFVIILHQIILFSLI